VPKLNELELHREPVDNRLRHGQCLGNLQDPATVKTIRNRATDSANEQPRQRVEKRNDTESDRGARELPYKPALRDILHKIARTGNQSAFQ
jgi:hypothetical protein